MVAAMKKTPFSLPTCRHCGRLWEPTHGKAAFSSYCDVCSSDRRAIAKSKLDLRAISPAETDSPYLLREAKARPY